MNLSEWEQWFLFVSVIALIISNIILWLERTEIRHRLRMCEMFCEPPTHPAPTNNDWMLGL